MILEAICKPLPAHTAGKWALSAPLASYAEGHLSACSTAR